MTRSSYEAAPRGFRVLPRRVGICPHALVGAVVCGLLSSLLLVVGAQGWREGAERERNQSNENRAALAAATSPVLALEDVAGVADGSWVTVGGEVNPASLRWRSEKLEPLPMTRSSRVASIRLKGLASDAPFEVILAVQDHPFFEKAGTVIVPAEGTYPVEGAPHYAHEELEWLMHGRHTFTGIVRRQDASVLLLASPRVQSVNRQGTAPPSGVLATFLAPFYLSAGGLSAACAFFIGASAAVARRKLTREQANRMTRPQLAGEDCAECRQRIVTERGATTCEHCSATLHAASCQARHLTSQHAESVGPYRS